MSDAAATQLRLKRGVLPWARLVQPGRRRYNRASVLVPLFEVTTMTHMKTSMIFGLACALGGLGAALPVAAQEQGNADAGRNKASMCVGCHNIPGYKTA